MKTGFVLMAGIAALGVCLESGPSRADSKAEPASKKGVQELYGIGWHRSLDKALQATQKSSPAKPIFILRTLGDLDGKT
jgi:hypothetical protein